MITHNFIRIVTKCNFLYATQKMKLTSFLLKFAVLQTIALDYDKQRWRRVWLSDQTQEVGLDMIILKVLSKLDDSMILYLPDVSTPGHTTTGQIVIYNSSNMWIPALGIWSMCSHKVIYCSGWPQIIPFFVCPFSQRVWILLA